MSKMKKLTQLIEELQSEEENIFTLPEVFALLESEEFKDLEGNEIEHIKNHFSKINKADICDVYGWDKDDPFIKYYDLCKENKK